MEYNWYVIRVLPSCEEKIRDAIYENSEKIGVRNDFEEVFIPYEEVVQIKRNVKVTKKRKIFPRHVFLHMKMSDEASNLVKELPKVVGFLQDKDKNVPQVINGKEIDSMRSKISQSAAVRRGVIDLEVGDKVEVIEGPFDSFVGIINAIDEDKKIIKVLITIFGRTTLLKLPLDRIKKIGEKDE